MNVLLIQPPLKKIDEYPAIPLSLLSIGTEIAASQNKVMILDLNLEAHVRKQAFNQDLLALVDNALHHFKT